MSMERLKEINKNLNGEPSIDEEEEAQVELVDLFQKLLENSEIDVDKTLLEQGLDLARNWDTLDKWFKENTELSSKISEIIAQFDERTNQGGSTEEKPSESEITPQEDSQQPLSDDLSQKLSKEIADAISQATKNLPPGVDIGTIIKTVTEQVTKNFMQNNSCAEEPHEEKKSTLSRDSIMMDMMKSVGKAPVKKIDTGVEKKPDSSAPSSKPKLMVPKITIPKVVKPQKKIKPKMQVIKDISADKRQVPPPSGQKKAGAIKLPQPKKISIPQPQRVKVNSVSNKPVANNASQKTGVQKVGAIKINTIKPVNKVSKPKIAIKPISGKSPAIKPVNTIKPVQGARPVQVIKPAGAAKPVQTVQRINGAKSVQPIQRVNSNAGPSRIMVKPVGAGPQNIVAKPKINVQAKPVVNQVKPVQPVSSGVNVVKPVNIPTNDAKNNLFNAFNKPNNAQKPGKAKVGSLTAINISGGDIGGFNTQKVSSVSSAPQEDFERADFNGDPYSNMSKDQLYQELIALEGKKYAIERMRKDMRSKHETGKLGDIEYKTAIDRYRYDLDHISSKINEIRKRLQTS